MLWCASCNAEAEVDVLETGGYSCCLACGRVLDDIAFSNDPTFVKGADGEGEMTGQFVSESGQVRGLARMAGGRVWGARSEGNEAAANKGRQELAGMIDHFLIRPREDTLDAAHRLYKLAVMHGFTKGRRVPQVAAACLYIITRQEDKPFMLIDYADQLQVNVYALGSVYLQLTQVLRLDEHPALTKPVDPSLYIHRFVERLGFGAKASMVARTALRLVASMKRDWMQTGRRPAGVCGAALFMASHVHGDPRSKRDVMAVVHIGWATLDKRVREFTDTSMASLTVAEFEAVAKNAEEAEERLLAAPPTEAAKQPQPAQACEHVAAGDPHFASGMCLRCFSQFIKVTGGVEGGSNPPAFQAGRRSTLALFAPGVSAEEIAAVERQLAAGDIDEDQRAQRPRGTGLLQRHARHGGRGAHAGKPAARAGDSAPAGGGAGRSCGGPAAGGTRVRQRAEGIRRRAAAAAGGAAGEGAARTKAQLRVSAAAAAAAAAVGGVGVDVGKGGGEGERGEAPGGGSMPSTPAGAAEVGVAAARGKRARGAPPAGAAAKRVRAADGGGAAAGSGPGSAEDESEEEVEVEEEEDSDLAGLKAAQRALVAREGDGAVSEGAAQGEGEGEAEPVDTLSDIDDQEVDSYISSEQEAQLKAMMWHEVHRDWILAQEVKAGQLREAAAAARAAAGGEGEAADAAEARVFAEAAASKRRGSRKRQRQTEPEREAGTAQESAMQMLESRKLTEKINYAALKGLFGDEDGEEGGEGADAGDGGGGAAASAAARGGTVAGGAAAGLPSKVSEALWKQAAERAEGAAQQDAHYSRQLEAAQRKGKRSTLGGLGGDLLEGLLMRKGGGGGAGGGGPARARPSGLAARARPGRL